MLARILAYFNGREAQVCVAILLLGALADWPYGYYQFLRLATCAAAVFCAWKALQEKRTAWVIGFVGIALLFNPFRIVHFRRDEWAWIDAVVALLFLSFAPSKKKTDAQ